MLILGRRVGQRVIINDDIVITVTSMQGGIAKLAFEAPDHVRINREEIYIKILKENLAKKIAL